ncbi:ArsR/SmtB family transcription factor [Xanthobacter variabilis]|uniref:ArsR/SmtB family transcription factor n=1 Tax=Xanthobacter variabilis TaxID=3119932 RepID=UPI00374E3A17
MAHISGMDDVFAALASPVRRALLDLLMAKDGQTLGELERQTQLTRFGVMKHLKVLEDAHLVLTRKVGREKHHYLNPAPIQLVSDRWISRYAAPHVAGMANLKALLEGSIPMSTAPTHVYELFIRATPEALWAVLTDDSKTPLYEHFNMTSRTDWRVGGARDYFMGERRVIEGKLVEIDPPRRLVMTFSAQWAPDVAADLPSRVTWEITPVGEDACKLTLTHDGFAAETATAKAVVHGWPEGLSRLKTLVETGTAFVVEAPAA